MKLSSWHADEDNVSLWFVIILVENYVEPLLIFWPARGTSESIVYFHRKIGAEIKSKLSGHFLESSNRICGSE